MTELPDDAALHADEATQARSGRARPSETIGGYRLLQRLGAGGMGDVWLAEQTRPVHRQVALKIIKAGMDTAQVVARFEAERQALAVMDHPAIARVFDGGATQQGRPYFVMEYVRGESIAAYCQRHKLSILDRIDLFLQLCDGVQHAHQKGIIHRDLKPSNILVTIQDDRPVPKIIDFGVAKATSQQLTERTLYTELGVLIGTPEYMSPEQAEMTGLDIDTRTDVYALGAVLYELLTGVLPFDGKALREKGIDEIRRTIREVDPLRPSTRLTALAAGDATTPRPVGLAAAKELRGDLDSITMRALEKDRTRRYGSVSDFAADLRRHLDNLPVLASPPSTVYRVSKFARRHRLGVGVAAAFVLLLFTFAATMALQARRIARERDRANLEAATAIQISNFLAGLFSVSDPSESRGNALTAREILDTGAAKVEKELASQPEVQARLMATIGKVYDGLGLYHSAERLLERAVSVDVQTLGPDNAQTLSATSELATAKWNLNRLAEAERLYGEVVDGRRRALGSEHPETLHAMDDLASVYVVQKRYDDAERLTKQTLEMQRRIVGLDHADTLYSLNLLQNIYYRQGHYDEAEPIARDVVERQQRLLGREHPDTLTNMHNLATIYDKLGRDSEAEPMYKAAIELKRRVLGDTHYSTVISVVRLAAMYQKEKRFAEAEAALLAVLNGLGADRGHLVAQGAELDIVKQLVTLYDQWGKPDMAARWRQELAQSPPKD